jgi:hypothetical protein
MTMGQKISIPGLFAVCLFIMVLFVGCSTVENPPNISPEETTGQTQSPTVSNSPTSPSANGTAYTPKFHPGDIIDVPPDEVGKNLAPDSGMVTYGRWIQNISYDNASVPIYHFSLIYWNETGQWYYTGYTGWKYSAYVDEVDHAKLLTHIDI